MPDGIPSPTVFDVIMADLEGLSTRTLRRGRNGYWYMFDGHGVCLYSLWSNEYNFISVNDFDGLFTAKESFALVNKLKEIDRTYQEPKKDIAEEKRKMVERVFGRGVSYCLR